MISVGSQWLTRRSIKRVGTLELQHGGGLVKLVADLRQAHPRRQRRQEQVQRSGRTAVSAAATPLRNACGIIDRARQNRCVN